MTIIMDITWAQFRELRKGIDYFYWLETKKEFILMRALTAGWLRCIVQKKGTEDDMLFIITELNSGIRVRKISGLINETEAKK